jgi:hypothetical protein
MVAALVPIWILGGAYIGVIVLNIVTGGGTTTGDRIHPNRMYQGTADTRPD